MRYLLVEPDFPIPPKSRNHKNFMPIGLLKIASYLHSQNHLVKLIRGTPKTPEEIVRIKRFEPDEVWITSLFTYWARFVRDSVQFYKNIFPNSSIIVGGIYASLLTKKEVKFYTGCDEVYQGVIPEVEEYIESCPPNYDLLDEVNQDKIEFQILHASRGCQRKCSFCGTWKIEPVFKPKKSIINEIHLPVVVFYDNNFLMNPYVDNILDELILLKRSRKIKWVESESGLDGRILLDKPHLAKMIKKAGFRYPRIAWDGRLDQSHQIKKQIDLLESAGYKSKDIYIFMLYNHNISFLEMEEKRVLCWNWQTQIADCRFRPLDQLFDNYKANTSGQTGEDYFISKNWNDALVKQFRKNVRRQNICVRMGYTIYSKDAERKNIDKDNLRKLKNKIDAKTKIRYLKKLEADWWDPKNITK